MLVTDDKFAKIARWFADQDSLITDCETTGLKVSNGDRLCGIGVGAFYRGTIRAAYFPFRHTTGSNLSEHRLNQLLEIILSRKLLINHHMKFDAGFFLAERPDAEIPPIRCTMVGAHMVDENRKYRGKGYSLEELGEELFGREATYWQRKLNDVLIENLLSKSDICRLPAEIVAKYGCEDVVLAGKLYNHLLPIIQQEEMEGAWDGISNYGVVLTRCQLRGIRVDTDVCKHLVGHSERMQVRTLEAMRDLAGYKLRPSPKSFANWLGMPSSAEEALKTVGLDDPRVKLIMEYRAYQKARGSYYLPFLKEAEIDGAFHPEFSQTSVITGRLSVPVAHALPSEDDEEKEDFYQVKTILIPRPGFSFIQADYKGAELRLATWYANAERMREIFNSGRNPHQETADAAEIPYSGAKRLNFSVIYGIGEDSLSEDLGIPVREARRYLDNYHKIHPEFKQFYNRCGRIAKRLGYIAMWSGRRRHYPDPSWNTPTHKATDHIIQGGIGEFLRERHTRLDAELRRMGVHQVLPVHDSALMECPTELVSETIPKIREILTVSHTDPILSVDITFGDKSLSKHQMEKAT